MIAPLDERPRSFRCPRCGGGSLIPATSTIRTSSKSWSISTAIALYFSRSPRSRSLRERPGSRSFKHIGLYAYRRRFVRELAALPQTPLELAESLEQLRALEHGFRIRAVETHYDSIGVDTPEDLERVRRQMTVGTRA